MIAVRKIFDLPVLYFVWNFRILLYRRKKVLIFYGPEHGKDNFSSSFRDDIQNNPALNDNFLCILG